jgi:hypothetical protein
VALSAGAFLLRQAGLPASRAYELKSQRHRTVKKSRKSNQRNPRAWIRASSMVLLPLSLIVPRSQWSSVLPPVLWPSALPPVLSMSW